MNVFRDVEEFHLHAGSYSADVDINLELDMLCEELNELFVAMQADDKVEIVDACLDIMYLAIGVALKHGVKTWQLTRAWKEVSRSNLDKVRGKIKRNAMGKIQKPEGWKPPDIKGALGI